MILVAPFIDCIICSLVRTVYNLSILGAPRHPPKFPYLYPQRYRLELHSCLIESVYVLPRPRQIFGLNFGGVELAFLRILLDLASQLALLLL